MNDAPEALIEGVLGALQRGIDAGAEALWGAMTARARAPMVDPAGARRALGNELLSPLVGHREHRIEPLEVLGEVARGVVRVMGDGGSVAYLISLRRTAQGWQVTGLRREDLPYS